MFFYNAEPTQVANLPKRAHQEDLIDCAIQSLLGGFGKQISEQGAALQDKEHGLNPSVVKKDPGFKSSEFKRQSKGADGDSIEFHNHGEDYSLL